MTVVTLDQMKAILAEIPDPLECDLCDAPLGADRRTRPYGPFTIHICPRCEWRFRKADHKNKRQRR